MQINSYAPPPIISNTRLFEMFLSKFQLIAAASVIRVFPFYSLAHIVVTVAIQYFFMRDLEKLIGWHRLAAIYLLSGIGGNLGSAIFVPYQAEVGPAGSHFGLLAGLFVDAIYSWSLIRRPWKAILQLGGVTLLLFLLGLLPWIDNWAHLFGFLFGLLLSFALFPYLQLGDHDRHKRVLIVLGCLGLTICLFALLAVLFYIPLFGECTGCDYFNCIPWFGNELCDNQGMELDKKLLPT